MVAIILASDLHLEFYQNGRSYEKGPIGNLPDPDSYDVVVLAGDIGSGLNGLQSMRLLIPEEKPIIYVPGNHEYYGKDYTVLNAALQYYEFENIHVLNPGSVQIGDVTFIGATLWSACRLPGYDVPDDYFKRCLADFRVIKNGPIELMSVGRMRMINNAEATFINQELDNAEGKTVVVTHFLPTMDCIAPQWLGDPLNPYFANNLPEVAKKTKLWLFGHTHNRMDFVNNDGTRLVANPHGYPGEVAEPWSWKHIEI